MTTSILFSQMTPPAGESAAFEQWYDEDHIARRMALDGFVGAERYWNDDDSDPHHLAIYTLESLEAVSTPEYKTLKAEPGEQTEYFLGHLSGFTRFTGSLISDQGAPDAHGSFLSVVAFEVPEADVDAFEEWYVEEHVPLLLRAEDWLRVHRYRLLDGDGGTWTHLALHELASREVMNSPERMAARQGPKRDALAARDWFQRSGRWVYRQVASHSSRTDDTTRGSAVAKGR